MKLETLMDVAKGATTEAAADAAAEVFTDGRARRAFEDLLYPEEESTLTQNERDIIHNFVLKHCKARTMEARLADFIRERQKALIEDDVSSWRLAASARDAVSAAQADEAQAKEDVKFVFSSGSHAQRGWRVSLNVLAKADADTPLDIYAEDGAGNPIDGGILHIAGVALPLVDGRSAIPMGMFLSGMKEPKVTLTFADGLEEGGTLSFM